MTYDGFKNLLIDSLGNVVMDQISQSEIGDETTIDSEAEILFKALGEEVSCMAHNPNRVDEIAIGSKN